MVNSQIRIKNLRLLIEDAGTIVSLAEKCDTSPAYISQIINGVTSKTGVPRGIGDKLARKLELGGNKEVGWLDVNHDDENSKDGTLFASNIFGSDARRIDDDQGMQFNGLRVMSIESDNNNYSYIKRVNLKLSAGITGFGVEVHTEDRTPIVMQKEWFTKRGYSPEKLLAVTVTGQSMEHGMFDGDTVVINTKDIAPKDGEVFAINYEGEMLIKRLLRDNGVWWLSSDNTDQRKYPRKECSGDMCLIIGRIVHKQSERI